MQLKEVNGSHSNNPGTCGGGRVPGCAHALCRVHAPVVHLQVLCHVKRGEFFVFFLLPGLSCYGTYWVRPGAHLVGATLPQRARQLLPHPSRPMQQLRPPCRQVSEPLRESYYGMVHRKHDGNSVCQLALYVIIAPLTVNIFHYLLAFNR